MPAIQNTNLSKIIKQLELIKSLISLEEEDEIDAKVFRLVPPLIYLIKVKLRRMTKDILSFMAPCLILQTIVPAMPLYDAHFGRFSLFYMGNLKNSC